MTNAASISNTNVSAVPPPSSADSKQMVLKDIRAKWGKFSEQELSSLKNKDDLVTQVVAKYGQEKAQAQREVDTLMKGRPF